MGTRVLLVEPNRIVRQGLRVELSRTGAEIVAEPATGAEAIAAAGEHRPDVVVLDLNLPDGSATEVCATLAREDPARPIIVLADPGDEAAVGAVVECGARAYLLKDAEDLDLADVISRVLAGESVIDPRAAAVLIDSRRTAEDAKLTAQELKVVRLAAEGLTNPEIGSRLFLSRHTVKEYLSHAMRKLDAANRIEAVRKATQLGLIEGVAQPAAGDRSAQADVLVYNASGGPGDNSDLKVTPLKIDELRPKRR